MKHLNYFSKTTYNFILISHLQCLWWVKSQKPEAYVAIKGQLGSKLHDVHIARRTKKIGILRPMIKVNEAEHIHVHMQCRETKILSIDTIQATVYEIINKLNSWSDNQIQNCAS